MEKKTKPGYSDILIGSAVCIALDVLMILALGLSPSVFLMGVVVDSIIMAAIITKHREKKN